MLQEEIRDNKRLTQQTAQAPRLQAASGKRFDKRIA